MASSMTTRMILIVATILFVGWTLLNTVCWPVEDYGNATLAYAESTNQVVRGMSLGVTGYLAVLGMLVGWNVSRRKAA